MRTPGTGSSLRSGDAMALSRVKRDGRRKVQAPVNRSLVGQDQIAKGAGVPATKPRSRRRDRVVVPPLPSRHVAYTHASVFASPAPVGARAPLSARLALLRRPGAADVPLLLAIVALLLTGLVMVYSAS